jgi:hypothetical protein
MATHRVLDLITAERASHARKCPRCNEAPPESRGSGFSSTVSRTSMSGERFTATIYIYGPLPPVPVLLVRHSAPRLDYPRA